MFGKTSRRWARSRMAEARQARLTTTADAVGNTQPVQAVVPDVSARKTVRFAG
jgi:hypothetical protein